MHRVRVVEEPVRHAEAGEHVREHEPALGELVAHGEERVVVGWLVAGRSGPVERVGALPDLAQDGRVAARDLLLQVAPEDPRAVLRVPEAAAVERDRGVGERAEVVEEEDVVVDGG